MYVYIWDHISHSLSFTFHCHLTYTVQQYTNSSYYQKFKSLLLLKPHSWACLMSRGAGVVYKLIQLACPNRQPAGNCHKTGWWDWTLMYVHSYILWYVGLKQPKLTPFGHNFIKFLNWNCPPLCDYPPFL